jgi:hypothetical protein
MNGHLKISDRGQGERGGNHLSGPVAAGEQGMNGGAVEDIDNPRLGVLLCYIHISYYVTYVCVYIYTCIVLCYM